MAPSARRPPPPPNPPAPPPNPPAEDPKVKEKERREARQEKGITWLVGAVTLVTAIYALFGTGAGAPVDRMFRHLPLWAFVGFALLIVGIGFGVWAYMVRSETSRMVLMAIGLVLVVVGLGTLTAGPTRVSATTEVPSVRATLKREGGLTIEATAKAAGLKTQDRLFVAVSGLVPRVTDARRLVYTRELLYRSQTGPDRAGLAELSFTVPLPPARYESIGVTAQVNGVEADCRFDAVVRPPPTGVIRASTEGIGGNLRGCLLLRVPPVGQRPQVFATVSGSGEERTVSIEVVGQNLQAADGIEVRVRGLRDSRGRLLYHSELGPDASGGVSGSIKVALPTNISSVCVEAESLIVASSQPAPRLARAKGGCPTRSGPFVAWVNLPLVRSVA